MGKPATTDTREIIVEILLDLEKGQDFSHKLIKAVLDKYDYLDPRDKAFIKRVTEGTIERQLELDYYLNRFSSVPVRKMKSLIRCLLRMSTYQILYMDAVPDSAVCNEACKLAAKRGFRTEGVCQCRPAKYIPQQGQNAPAGSCGSCKIFQRKIFHAGMDRESVASGIRHGGNGNTSHGTA